MSQTELLSLVKNLVHIKSLSREEDGIADFLYNYMKRRGVSTERYRNNVYSIAGTGNKTLLLNSHLDTIPPSVEWSSDPYTPVEMDGKLYGLGANDAKSCVATMLYAFMDSLNRINGRLVFAATCEEESGGNNGLSALYGQLPPIDAAIIGEPTDFRIGIGIRGLMYLKFIEHGRSGHASRPHEGINAIELAMENIRKIKSLEFEEHPLLGKPTISITSINAGIRNNVIPPTCEYVADVRSTPIYNNKKLQEMIKSAVTSEVVVLSDRLESKITSEAEDIVVAAKRVIPNSTVYGFPAMCDFVFSQCPGMILCPGRSLESHTANEFIEIERITKARNLYSAVIRQYFR